MTTNDEITLWRVLDFHPDPAGWRALYFDAAAGPGEFYTEPIAGWLVQAEEDYSHGRLSPRQPPLAERERRIVAAAADAWTGELEPVCDLANFWRLLGPGEPLPSGADAQQGQELREQEKRQEQARAQRRHQEAEAARLDRLDQREQREQRLARDRQRAERRGYRGRELVVTQNRGQS